MKEYTVKVYENGTKHWFLNGKRHREDGPAIEWSNGDKEWFLNGKLHREDGPAIECVNGDKVWFLNGKRVTEQQVMNSTKELTVQEISELLGYNVKVVKQ